MNSSQNTEVCSLSGEGQVSLVSEGHITNCPVIIFHHYYPCFFYNTLQYCKILFYNLLEKSLVELNTEKKFDK